MGKRWKEDDGGEMCEGDGCVVIVCLFFFNDTATTEIYTLSLHDALPILGGRGADNYTIAQVSRLQTLCPMMKATNPQLSELTDQILNRVRTGIIRNVRRNREIDNTLAEINRQPPELKNIIKTIFYKVFYAGMYMRRWLGPGNRYPIRAGQTRGGGNPMPRTIIALGEVSEHLAQMDMANETLANRIRQLPDIDYNSDSGNIIFRTDRLFYFISQLAEGNECIRIGSRHLVISAYYYLSVIFGEIIPDFDSHSVDIIA